MYAAGLCPWVHLMHADGELSVYTHLIIDMTYHVAYSAMPRANMAALVRRGIACWARHHTGAAHANHAHKSPAQHNLRERHEQQPAAWERPHKPRFIDAGLATTRRGTAEQDKHTRWTARSTAAPLGAHSALPHRHTLATRRKPHDHDTH